MEREWWVETASGTEVSGPYRTEQGAKQERRDRQGEHEEVLVVVASDDEDG